MTSFASASLQNIAQGFLGAYPDIHSLARLGAGHIIENALGYWLDPDQVYWHRFDHAVSSNRTFSGWAHYSAPIESMTLSELIQRRFTLNDQLNPDLLSNYGGFYRVGAGHGHYDERVEVRLAPENVMEAFWALDLQSVYLQTLERFWAQHADNFCLLARAQFLTALAHAREKEGLSDAEQQAVLRAAVGLIRFPATLARLRQSQGEGVNSGFSALSFSGQVARDMFWLVLPSNALLLYLASETPALIRFTGKDQLYAWIKEQVADEPGQQRFQQHFPDLDPAAGKVLCERLSAGQRVLNWDVAPVAGDVFVHLREAAKQELKAVALARITANSDLRKAKWLAWLGVVSRVVSPLAPLGWPLALAAVGAGAASLGLHLDQAVNASDIRQRRRGWVLAVVDLLFVLLDAKMLEADAFNGEARAVRTPGGSEAVPLTRAPQVALPPLPVDAQPVGTPPLSDGNSTFWTACMRPAADELLALSDQALARQRSLLTHLPEADLERVSASGDYLDPFGEPYVVYRDELGFGARLIKQYSHSPQRYNNLLRGLPLEGTVDANVARIHALSKELGMVGCDNQVRLYRAASAARGTSGAWLKRGQVKVGDVLLTTDFTSFTENPYTLWELFREDRSAVQARFDESSVVFVLEPGGPAYASPVAAFSDLEHEAEALILPGRPLRILDIAEVVGADFRFTQVRLQGVESVAPDEAMFEFRTGEPFQRAAYARRLGGVGQSLVERFFPQP